MVYHRRLRLPADASHRLTCYLGNFLVDSFTDVRTRLIPDSLRNGPEGGRSCLLSSFMKHIDLDSAHDSVRVEEYAARLNVGPASVKLRWTEPVNGKPSMKDAVNKFFEPHPTVIDGWQNKKLPPDIQRAADYADQIVRSLYDVSRNPLLSHLSLEDAFWLFARKRSYGFPFISSDDDAYHYPAYQLSHELLSTLDRRLALCFPAILGTRLQMAGPDLPSKSRVVLGCSRVTNNIAKMLFEALFPVLSVHPSLAAWSGPQGVDLVMPSFLRDARGPMLSVDFSGFDASVAPSLISRVFRIIKHWFKRESHALVDFVEFEFNACGVVVPGSAGSNRDLLMGRGGGVPSGHVLTNLVDSLVNLWAMAFAAFREGVTLHQYMMQGDDGVYSFIGKVDLPKLSERLLVELGLTMHPHKCQWSREQVTFCSMLHRLDIAGGKGVRSLIKTLAQMMSHERGKGDDWTDEMDLIRWLQQLDACQYHPCFLRACEWVHARIPALSTPVDAIIDSIGGHDTAISAYDGKGNEYNFDCLRRLPSSAAARAMLLYA